jgi:hypothetical protein
LNVAVYVRRGCRLALRDPQHFGRW